MRNYLSYTLPPLLAVAVACTGYVSDPGGSPSDGSGAGSGNGNGATGGSSGGSSDLQIQLHGAPLFSRFVRLTHDQWELSVRDLLELDAPPGLSSGFASDPPEGKFSNNERALFVTATLRGDYQRAVEALSQQVTRDPDALARLTDGVSDPAELMRRVGRRIYRRPLAADELARYERLFALGPQAFASGDDFADGVQLFLEAALQSPHFLYRTELGDDGAPLSGFELASKLSFLFRNTTPDEALLNAAEAGELDSAEGLERWARELLAEPGAEQTFIRFHAELFGFDRYQAIAKDPAVFPAYTETLNADLRAADERFVSEIFTRDLGLRELLTSTLGYVNAELAPLYGVSADSSEWSLVDLGPDRPGLFSRVGFLALNATLRHPDPIHRGVDLNHRVLCAELAPPPGTIPALPESQPGQTNRERVTAHTGPGTCGASCHGQIINPLGFAFENFDAIGQLRTTDNGKPVDTAAEYAFADGLKGFSGAPELLDLIASSKQAHSCYSSHLAEFALGRDLAEPDYPLVSHLQTTSMSPNSSMKQIVLAIVTDPAFRTRSGGTP